MADQSSSPLGLPPSVWAVLIVGLAGALAASQHPFQDVRPSDSSTPAYRHAPSEDQDIEARQWEDPFSAIAIARRGSTSSKEAGTAQPGDSQHSLARLAKDRLNIEKTPVLVLGVMVPGAPYADDIETRRRTRYAILAGLFQQGYVSDDSEHIGFIADPSLPTHIVAYEWLHREATVEIEKTPHVLLMWLDQDSFRSTPFASFSRIVNSIADDKPGTIAGSIIGPADSDGLKAMSSELDQDPKDGCQFLSSPQFPNAPQRDISVYSPRATALNWLIVSDEVKKRYPDTETDPHADHFHDRCMHINLFRTVANDFSVARAVYKELQYRGIKSVAEIALVSERDTLYARSMSRYFNGCYGTKPVRDRFTVTKFADEDSDGEGDQTEDKTQPLCFTYLTGLDGLVPPTPDIDSAKASSDLKPAAAAAAPVPMAKESAIGRGQLDYLRRLTADLASIRDDPGCRRVTRVLSLNETSDQIVQRCSHHIRAIGVIGSDIYDKLMVLQALRRAFPRYIFFTTDMDARLTDTQNLQWTREMVVGSSTGLALQRELQGSVPPFRDSYQAAEYYSTIQAVHRFLDSQKQKPKIEGASMDVFWTHRPHVFEIGRTEAFDLSAYKDANTACDLDGDCHAIAAWRQPPIWSRGSFLFHSICAVAVMLIAILMTDAAMGTSWIIGLVAQPKTTPPDTAPQGPSAAKRPLLIALFSLAVIAALSFAAWTALLDTLTNGGRRTPTPIFSGATHWTASLIEALSILLVITLVIRGQRKLRDNATTMLEEFKFPLKPDILAAKYRDWLVTAKSHQRWKERFWFPFKRLSGNKKEPLVQSAAASAEATAVATKKPATPLDDLSELEALIGQYLYRGRWQARIVRVTVATVISCAVLLTLEYILMLLEFNLGISLVNGFDFIDFRVPVQGIENLISLVNLVAIQFLIFWVADALLLTRSFVLALAKDRPTWPTKVLDTQSTILGLDDTWTAKWLDLRLIAWRTGRVSSLIWYPSLMIAAMVLAALTVEFGELGFASNPIALIISAGFVISAAVLLRRVAEDWRSDVLFSIEDGRLAALGAKDTTTSDQLERLSERVSALSDGAFAPYSQQPLVRAVLVPVLTYGATAGVQYLHLGS